jgi:transcriptional regulator with XRE-family HTH domain
MVVERKSAREAQILGERLRRLRTSAAVTLQEVADQTGIDVGQLSRFECGSFKRLSRNLQKYQRYLQDRNPISASGTDELTAAVSRLAARSPRHRAAAQVILEALERLD